MLRRFLADPVVPRSTALRIAADDSARALQYGAGVWIAVIVVHAAVVQDLSGPLIISGLALTIAFVATGRLLQRRRARPALVFRAVAAATALVGLWLLAAYDVSRDWDALLLVAVLLTASGAFVTTWPEYLAAAATIIAGGVVAIQRDPVPHTTHWIIGFASAIAAGTMLLGMRRSELRTLARAEEAVRRLSTRDPLTGLLNRHGLDEHLPATWADARRRHEPVTVRFLDLRGLKRANDDHGHAVGDAAIREAAGAITDTARGSDLVARWGGDEFVMVSIGDGVAHDVFCDRVNATFASRSSARRDGHVGEISVGRAVGDPATTTFYRLLRDADVDMYDARRDP